MTLSQDSYTFAGLTLHQDVIPEDTHEAHNVIGQFFGVIGEAVILDSPKGRELSMTGTLVGYATYASLMTAFDAINAQQNQLSGTLTVTLAGSSHDYPNCTFKGATRERPIKNAVDGTWRLPITLRWRQRSP